MTQTATIASGTALAAIEDIKLPVKFLTEEVTDAIDQITRAAKEKAAGLDISIKREREEIVSTARKVSTSKVAMLALSKTLKDRRRAEIADEVNGILAEEKRITAELDALRDEIRKPVTDWEDAEKARIAGHEAAIENIETIARFRSGFTPDAPSYDPDAGTIKDRIAKLDALPLRDWREFTSRAEKIIAFAREDLAHKLVRAQQREAEAAELARLQAAEAERQRKEHEAQIAAVAAENAKREAEERAKQLAEEQAAIAEAARQAEADKVERARLAAEAAAQAERDASAAREREIQAAAELAEQQRKQAELDRIAAENRAAAVERQRAADAERAVKDLRAAEQRRLDAEIAAKAAADLAERNRLEAIAYNARIAAEHEAKAKRDQAVAIEAEQARVAKIAAEQEKARKERERDVENRKKVNGAARDAIMLQFGSLMADRPDVLALSDEAAKALATEIVEAIARGEIPHVAINY